MADSTYRVGVLLDLAAGRFRRGAKAAAKDTDRLGGTLRKAAGSGSLMGRGVAEGSRRARREVRQTAQETQRLGRSLRVTGRDGEQSLGRLTRRLKGVRTEAGLAARAAGRLRGGLLGIAGIAGGGFAVASGLRRVITMEERMERLGIQSGRTTEEMARLRKEVYATANLPEIRLDPSQVLAAVEAIVEKTGDLDFARDNLLLIAQSIQGSGGTGDALGRLSAELRKLGIADPAGVAQALNLITAQGKSGAFTLGNMAAQGERLFSAFARLDYQGAGAVRQLGAISQMARQSTGSSEQAATAVEALLRTLSDAQKVDSIWSELGVNVRDATGAFRPLDRILKEIIDAAGGDITRLSEIFDAEAIRGISGLATAPGRADYERFLTIEAPADMLGRDAARIASWSGQSIGEIATAIAERASLAAAVSPALGSVRPAGAMQSDESDEQFLRRLVARLNGRVVHKHGRLMVLAAGESESVSGSPLPPVEIDLRATGAWVRWRRSEAAIVDVVQARHLEADGTTPAFLTLGNIPRGRRPQRRRLPGLFASADDAEAAIRRMLAAGRSGFDYVEVRTSLMPEARALYPVSLSGVPEGFPTRLTIHQARHELSRRVATTTVTARP